MDEKAVNRVIKEAIERHERQAIVISAVGMAFSLSISLLFAILF